MNYLHYQLHVGANELIQISLDRQAYVRLLDDVNYGLYRKGARYRYYGGLAKQSPVTVRAPRPGRWHLVIDLGGFAGTVRASVRTIRG